MFTVTSKLSIKDMFRFSSRNTDFDWFEIFCHGNTVGFFLLYESENNHTQIL